MKTIKWIFIILGVLIILPIGTIAIYSNFFYETELNKIKAELSKIEGASVLDIWGYRDLTLEEVAARIYIEDKGEIILRNLSSDVYDYPNQVWIEEIGGFSFKQIYCSESLGFGDLLDISKNSEVGKLIGVDFNSPREVIENYDKILEVIKSLKRVPKLNYYEHENHEKYLMVIQNESTDIRPLYDSINVKNLADFGRTLKWKKSICN